MKNPSSLSRFAALVVSIFLTAPASAVVLFSSLSPSGTYQPFGGLEVRAEPLPSSSVAASFTPTRSRPLESIDLGLRSLIPPVGGGAVVVGLFESNSAGLPGTELESFRLSDFPFFGGPEPLESRLETATSLQRPRLQAGREYFIVLTTVPSNFSTIWVGSTETVDAPVYRSVDGGPFTLQPGVPYPALRVNGVPEPALLSLALLSFPTLLRRSRS